MPITGKTHIEVARIFARHVNSVVARTVTQARVVAFVGGGRSRTAPEIQIAFRQGAAATRAMIQTRFGRMGLYVGQVCEAVPVEKGLLRLRTLQYKYTISCEQSHDPIFRWEYVRQPEPGEQWCRHHLQGPVPLLFNDVGVSMNELHLPTGYVPFEEVLRFCIVDLKVKPLTDSWDEVLTESYEDFRGDFLR